MTPTEQFQLSAELALAREQIGDALEGLARYINLANIHHLEGRPAIYLAAFHLREAAALIVKQNTGAKDPLPPTIDSLIALAKNGGSRGDEALTHSLSSPATAANIESPDAPPTIGENEKPAAGEANLQPQTK